MRWQGVTLTRVGCDMNIGADVVSRWVWEANAGKFQALPGRGQQELEGAEK